MDFKIEKQESYPAAGSSWSQFFRNQEQLEDFRMIPDLAEALNGSEAVVFAVRHKDYMDLDPDQVVEMAGGPLAVIDCFGILDDEKIKRYIELGCEVKGLGRGHIKRIKDKVLKSAWLLFPELYESSYLFQSPGGLSQIHHLI